MATRRHKPEEIVTKLRQVALIRCVTCWVFPNAVPVVCLASIVPHNGICRGAEKMKNGLSRI